MADEQELKKRGSGRTGPRTTEGKERVKWNRMTHGMCSKQGLLPGESEEDWKRLVESWFEKYAPVDECERDLVARVVESDWQERRALKQFRALEARMHKVDPEVWSEEQHKTYERFLRYKTTAERAFTRALRMIEQQCKARPVEQTTVVAKKQAAVAVAVAVETPVAVERRRLVQTVVVSVEEGQVATWTHPDFAALQRILAVRGARDAETRVVREFEFPQGVPDEYRWISGEAEQRAAGARFRQTLRLAEWRDLLEREKAEAGGHMRPGGVVEFSGVIGEA